MLRQTARSGFAAAGLGSVARRPVRGTLSVAYVLVVVFFASDGFKLWFVEGFQERTGDIGQALLWGALFVFLVVKGVPRVFHNAISVLILFHLVFLCVQVALASFYYEQSLGEGIRAVRGHFYYVSFFVFLALLDTPEKIRTLLNLLSVSALIAFAIAVLNYGLGLELLYQFTDHAGHRAGVVRWFVPAMDVVTFATLWELSKLSGRSSQASIGWGAGTALLLMAAHILRQTRMRTISVAAVILALLCMRGKWAIMAAFAISVAIGVVVVDMMMPQNIITEQFTSAAEDVSEEGGTWEPRLKQLQVAVDLFYKHPLLGSGSVALQRKGQSDLHDIVYAADLGYVSWLKAYGLVGVLWLGILFYLMFSMGLQVSRARGDRIRDLGPFVLSYAGFVALSAVTLNHFMYPKRLLLVCLMLAILVRLREYDKRKPLSIGRDSPSAPITLADDRVGSKRA